MGNRQWAMGLHAAGLALCLILTAGCITRVKKAGVSVASSPDVTATASAHAAVERPIPAIDRSFPAPWPGRWGTERTGRAGVILPLEGPLARWHGRRLGEFHHLYSGSVERQDADALAQAIGADAGFQFRAEGPGAYIFIHDDQLVIEDPSPIPPPPDGLVLFKHVSGVPGGAWDEIERVKLERTWFMLGDGEGRRSKGKGLVVIMPGLFGTPEPVVDAVMRALRARGWTVLRMLSEPSRFTERVKVTVEGDDYTAEAQHFAHELGDRVASTAYAAAEGVGYVHKLRPALADKPVVLFGMSGGAIALPTVHAFRPELYDGAITVAGGVNFLKIDLLSNYADWIEAIDITWPGGEEAKPTPAQIDAISQAYLEASPLDGYHFAPLLTEKPVLMVHGSGDRAVPAATGELLWQRMGQPERWVLPVGHELIFAALPSQMRRINSWLDDQFIVDNATD